ncbi:hypothetical protein Ddc_15017 [Ditylenchus destructor]|nr:hypothetical protein Ddc_15017 [Ditylenchus destructor]
MRDVDHQKGIVDADEVLQVACHRDHRKMVLTSVLWEDLAVTKTVVEACLHLGANSKMVEVQDQEECRHLGANSKVVEEGSGGMPPFGGQQQNGGSSGSGGMPPFGPPPFGQQ